jgi:protein-serine/threonine kinase
MQQLLTEPEDRLGSQELAPFVSRPNSIVVPARRSGFIPQLGISTENDGAHVIKVKSNT